MLELLVGHFDSMEYAAEAMIVPPKASALLALCVWAVPSVNYWRTQYPGTLLLPERNGK
jgi:hypothetical protein